MTAGQQSGADKTSIRPFRVNFPDAELVELRNRINATRWPDRETVADQSQGVQLVTMQALARYWATEYDWRKVEAKLNALPQFSDRDRRARRSFSSTFRSKHDQMRLPLIITRLAPAQSSSS